MKSWISDARFFPYLTWKQVEQLPKQTLLVLPTASITQHGPHLPLATDTLIGSHLLGRALDLLPADLPIYALPPICYGKSAENRGFPGNLSVSTATFLAVLRDLGESVRASGLNRIVLLNTHGGNRSLVDAAARDLHAELGLDVYCLFSTSLKLPGVEGAEAAFAYHAGEVETSLLMAATPDLVRPEEYTAKYVKKLDDPRKLVPEFGGATYTWTARELSASGVLGDPSGATPEKGRLWSDLVIRAMADLLLEMYAFTRPT
jgi:creatinine amidohydrolase